MSAGHDAARAEIQKLYAEVTKVVRQYHPEAEGRWFSSKCERSKGYLYGMGGFGLIASGTIGSYREFDLLALVLNSLPLLLEGPVLRTTSAPERATPEMIAAAWDAYRAGRPGRMLGPGSAFVEAINAALAVSARAKISAE